MERPAVLTQPAGPPLGSCVAGDGLLSLQRSVWQLLCPECSAPGSKAPSLLPSVLSLRPAPTPGRSRRRHQPTLAECLSGARGARQGQRTMAVLGHLWLGQLWVLCRRIWSPPPPPCPLPPPKQVDSIRPKRAFPPRLPAVGPTGRGKILTPGLCLAFQICLSLEKRERHLTFVECSPNMARAPERLPPRARLMTVLPSPR